MGAVVTIAYVACWIPFAPSLGYERNRTINELTWSVAAVGVFAIGTLYPLFLCVAHEREMRAQLRAVHAISTVQELLSFNAGFEAFFKFSRAEFRSVSLAWIPFSSALLSIAARRTCCLCAAWTASLATSPAALRGSASPGCCPRSRTAHRRPLLLRPLPPLLLLPAAPPALRCRPGTSSPHRLPLLGLRRNSRSCMDTLP